MKINQPISTLLYHKSSALWTVEPDTTVFEAIRLMAEKNVGALLVVDGGRLLGVFNERDYTRKVALLGKSSKETAVQEIIARDIVSVAPEDTIENCMWLMTQHRLRHLPVLEGQRLIGIVSIGDLVNWIISAQNAAIEQMEQYIAGSVAA